MKGDGPLPLKPQNRRSSFDLKPLVKTNNSNAPTRGHLFARRGVFCGRPCARQRFSVFSGTLYIVSAQDGKLSARDCSNEPPHRTRLFPNAVLRPCSGRTEWEAVQRRRLIRNAPFPRCMARPRRRQGGSYRVLIENGMRAAGFRRNRRLAGSSACLFRAWDKKCQKKFEKSFLPY